jgi:ADP-heptose:LPS heptosyltransferase
MPEPIEQFGVALQFLQRLRETQPDWGITVITRSETISLLDRDKLKIDIQPYSKKEINVLGLPKSALKDALRKRKHDVTLDLTTEVNMFCIRLLQLSGASVHVAFHCSEKAPYYNLGIRVAASEPLANKYHTMLKYLNAIANSKRHAKVQVK